MTTYRFTINLRLDNNEYLTEDEIHEVIQHLLELKQYADVEGITYTR